jgi:16S rRNA (cytosine1407-C5)-methyltransferase
MRKPLRSNFKKSRKPQAPTKKVFFTKENLFVSRIASILMIPKQKVIGIFSQRAITTIRLNPLKGNVEETKKSLEVKGYELEAIEWDQYSYFIRNHDKSEVSQTLDTQDGKFYNPKSLKYLDTLVFRSKRRRKYSLICERSRSKTKLIDALHKQQGKILANDADMSRVNSLKKF